MIKFEIQSNLLLLVYGSSLGSTEWVYHVLKEDEYVIVKKTFTFSLDDVQNLSIKEQLAPYGGVYKFVLGKLEGNYFKIEGYKLNIEGNLYIYKEIELTPNFFVATRDISIFKKINKIFDGDIYIGGGHDSSIPEEEFQKLIKNFPNSYELTKYAEARVGSIVKDYIDIKYDTESKYNSYLNKKISKKGDDIYSQFREIEIVKYQAIHKKLQEMLDNEVGYNERQWQKEILQIILLLYPKYIHIFTETPVRDDSSSEKIKKRFLDFLLVNADGYIDIVEIKKPSDNSIITKKTYRDNYIPPKELSGTIMQIEKYIFYLNRWGKKGEEYLTKKYKDKLPDKFKIKITNPSGFIILGRDNNLSNNQKKDFEVIKRKYKNIIDILTYDDLIRRVEFAITSLQILKN
jgi:hypothetical protein